MKHIDASTLVLAFAAACAGCGSGSDNAAVPHGITDSEKQATYAMELQHTQVPMTITDPQAAAGHAMIHFWDKMDFTDSARVADDTFMEHNFAEYLSIFPYSNADDAATAVNELMRRAETSPAVYRKVMEVAERFLTSPNSVMRDEETFLLFLQAADRSDFTDSATRQRVRSQMADVLKNRRGTPAANFAIIDRDGRRTSLYDEAKSGVWRILVFYDPDCDHCSETIAELRQSPEVSQAVASGRAMVMAVYPDGDYDVWQKARHSMPDGWFNGMSPEGEVSEKEIYTLPAMPVIYLIAPDNTVVLKDTSLPQLMESLAELAAGE